MGINKAEPKSTKRFIVIVTGMLVLSMVIVALIAALCYGDGIFFGVATLISAWTLMFTILLALYGYLIFINKADNTTVWMSYVTVFLTVVVCAVLAKFQTFYIMPLAMCPLILCVNLDKNVAVMGNIATTGLVCLFCIMMSQVSNGAAGELAIVSSEFVSICIQSVLGFFIIFYVKPYYSRVKMFGVCMILAAASFAVSFLGSTISNEIEVMDMLMVALYNFYGSVLAVLIFFFFSPVLEWVFNLKTYFRLMEICSFDRPLLKELSDKAPGTFNHCITVANIVERCAYAIGENPILAKAAALYHDIGKLENPEYFTENQTNGYNPHDDLILEVSVNMITRHTDVGSGMLKDKGYPPEVIAAAKEHHGDSPLSYFYTKAQNITEGKLASENYRYNGPKPTTKISAMVMIADISEAATRSVQPNSKEELSTLVGKLIKEKSDQNQFDECPITMKELMIIRNTVVDTLLGVYHNRISYANKKAVK